MSELPPDERPREKLLAHGSGALAEAELLAILLRTGKRGEPVLELARRWLADVGGLAGLAALDVRQLMQRSGVSVAKAATLAAALELGRRLARQRLSGRSLLSRPEEVASVLIPKYGGERAEVFGCVTLDVRNRMLGEHPVHRGGRAHAHVEPAEVFHVAIKENAHAVILWHTHPSGDPTPSEDDIALTRRLVEAGRLLNIQVLDHLIIVRGGHVSLRQRGLVTSG